MRLLILILLFGGGLLWGLTYNPVGGPTTHVQQVEVTEDANEGMEEDVYVETFQKEDIADHPVEKMARIFEKLTTTFFEKIVSLLFAITQLFF